MFRIPFEHVGHSSVSDLFTPFGRTGILACHLIISQTGMSDLPLPVLYLIYVRQECLTYLVMERTNRSYILLISSHSLPWACKYLEANNFCISFRNEPRGLVSERQSHA